MEPGGAHDFVASLGAEELFNHLGVELHHIISSFVFLNHEVLWKLVLCSSRSRTRTNDFICPEEEPFFVISKLPLAFFFAGVMLPDLLRIWIPRVGTVRVRHLPHDLGHFLASSHVWQFAGISSPNTDTRRKVN